MAGLTAAHRCQSELEPVVHALAGRTDGGTPTTGRRPTEIVWIYLRYECEPIPRGVAQTSCVTLNRRWIHPCHVAGAVFSAAEGYACPICKLTFERQRAGEVVYEAPK